jgi:hypothetical protein
LSCVLPCLCPGVTTTESGRPLPSQARCTLVENPSLLRPKASSSSRGLGAPFCVLPLGWLAPRTSGMVVGTHHGVVHAHLPLDLSDRVRVGLRMRQEAIPQVPSLLQRLKRSKQVCQGPYLCGRSRQGEPVRSFHRMPLMTVRWSLHWPPLWPCSGKSGSISCQAWSVISPRLTIAVPSPGCLPIMG